MNQYKLIKQEPRERYCLLTLKGDCNYGDYFQINQMEGVGVMKLKLYQCDIIDDCENETIIIVAKNDIDARRQIEEMDWNCLMNICCFEISNINGHKIVVK